MAPDNGKAYDGQQMKYRLHGNVFTLHEVMMLRLDEENMFTGVYCILCPTMCLPCQ